MHDDTNISQEEQEQTETPDTLLTLIQFAERSRITLITSCYVICEVLQKLLQICGM